MNIIGITSKIVVIRLFAILSLFPNVRTENLYTICQWVRKTWNLNAYYGI